MLLIWMFCFSTYIIQEAITIREEILYKRQFYSIINMAIRNHKINKTQSKTCKLILHKETL